MLIGHKRFAHRITWRRWMIFGLITEFLFGVPANHLIVVEELHGSLLTTHLYAGKFLMELIASTSSQLHGIVQGPRKKLAILFRILYLETHGGFIFQTLIQALGSSENAAPVFGKHHSGASTFDMVGRQILHLFDFINRLANRHLFFHHLQSSKEHYGHHIQKPYSKSCRICQSWAGFTKHFLSVATVTVQKCFA